MNTHLNVLYKKADHIARYVVRSFRNYYTVRAIRKRARLRAILLELGSRRQTLINVIPANTCANDGRSIFVVGASIARLRECV